MRVRLTPRASATDLTMKLGAFPMWVLAPMNTDPGLMARSTAWLTPATSLGRESPLAKLRNTK